MSWLEDARTRAKRRKSRWNPLLYATIASLAPTLLGALMPW